MSTLQIPEDVLRQLGDTDREALVEIACQLFDKGRLTLFFAGKLAGLTRAEMEDALLDRGIPIYRPTVEDLEQDLRAIERYRRE